MQGEGMVASRRREEEAKLVFSFRQVDLEVGVLG